LPTEAEWEYACRAGTTTPYAFGDSLSTKQANFHADRTCKVGSYAPNAWGLHDMHGNVREWTSDFYDENYYAGSPRKDPPGPATGTRRVLRGGAFNYVATSCRSACRHDWGTGIYTVGCHGVRVALPAR
jgi:formylglycine-generating enzyme required for sulfatase activity